MKEFQGYKYIDGGVTAAKGFKAGGIHSGLSKNPNKNDLGMIVAENLCTASAVYTQNKVKGAPIIVTQKNISNAKAQAVIVNSANANTCNSDGEEKAEKMCQLASMATGIPTEDFIVASTGVIGQILNIKPIEDNIQKLVKSLSTDGSEACAKAIMTTDLNKKELAVEFFIGDKICKIGGIAKGSGMIHPNMATMLCFMTTDVAISSQMITKILGEVTKVTFNRVSVDGDTSTNDMACILASGIAQNIEITDEGESYDAFKQALFIIMMNLSREIARDGEGATKLLECVVFNAQTEKIAEIISKAVITSSLFKAAMFGADANWGRILCAIGYADAEFDITKVAVSLSSKSGKVDVCENGTGIEFSEEIAKKVLSENEIIISIYLNDGDESATAWGCDLTYDYVKINGDYRS